MIIDINAYLGSWPYWPLIDNSADAMLAKMDRYGIEKAFLSSLKAVFTDPKEGNAEVLKAVGQHPDRFYPALSYSPYEKDRNRYQEELASIEVRMVKLFPINQSYDPLEEPFVEDLFDHCCEYKIPVMIPHRLMMTWRLPTFDLNKIGRLVELHPSTQIVIGSVNYLFELQTSLAIARRYRNVYLDTSAMMAYREIETVVGEIGADRLLHGTCNPLQNPAIGPLKIQSAEIPEEDKEKILAGNAIRLFDLKTGSKA
jgi:hypothetical protein